MTKSIREQVLEDEDRIYALVHLNEMKTRLDLHELKRQVMTIAVPRNAQERHIKEYGHRLELGCCAKRNLEVASEALRNRDVIAEDSSSDHVEDGRAQQ